MVCSVSLTTTPRLQCRPLLAASFWGVKQLMSTAQAHWAQWHFVTAKRMLLAQKAYALKPAHEEVQDTLLKLQAEKGDWKTDVPACFSCHGMGGEGGALAG